MLPAEERIFSQRHLAFNSGRNAEQKLEARKSVSEDEIILSDVAVMFGIVKSFKTARAVTCSVARCLSLAVTACSVRSSCSMMLDVAAVPRASSLRTSWQTKRADHVSLD